MTVDIQRVLQAAVEAALDDGTQAVSKERLSAGKAIAIGAALVSAGRVAAGPSGRVLRDKIQEQLSGDSHPEETAETQRKQDDDHEEFQAEAEEEFEPEAEEEFEPEAEEDQAPDAEPDEEREAERDEEPEGEDGEALRTEAAEDPSGSRPRPPILDRPESKRKSRVQRLARPPQDSRRAGRGADGRIAPPRRPARPPTAAARD